MFWISAVPKKKKERNVLDQHMHKENLQGFQYIYHVGLYTYITRCTIRILTELSTL